MHTERDSLSLSGMNGSARREKCCLGPYIAVTERFWNEEVDAAVGGYVRVFSFFFLELLTSSKTDYLGKWAVSADISSEL